MAKTFYFIQDMQSKIMKKIKLFHLQHSVHCVGEVREEKAVRTFEKWLCFNITENEREN